MISIAVSIDYFQIIDKFYSFQRKLILKLAFTFLYSGNCVGDCSECCDEVDVSGLVTNTWLEGTYAKQNGTSKDRSYFLMSKQLNFGNGPELIDCYIHWIGYTWIVSIDWYKYYYIFIFCEVLYTRILQLQYFKSNSLNLVEC